MSIIENYGAKIELIALGQGQLANFAVMAKAKKKFYVVWEGHNTGIFDSWEKCLQQVKGYPNAKYKAYTSREEAEEAVSHFPGWEKKTRKKPLGFDAAAHLKIDAAALAVDAACSGNPGLMEYRGVWVADSAEVFHEGPFQEGTNNVGEFLAIVHALALLAKRGDGKTRIYTDSRTAMKWVKMKKANTKLERNSKNERLFVYIQRAEAWLKSNNYSNPVEKWDTEKWGEIPADFGRK